MYNWLADDVESTITRPIANNRQVAPTIRWYEASGRSNTASHGGTRFRGADPGGHSAGRGTPARPSWPGTPRSAGCAVIGRPPGV